MKAVDVLGVKVKPDQVDHLVSEQLSSGSLWGNRDDYENASGLERAIRAIAGSPLERRFIDAVLKRITDPDAATRRGALMTIRNFGNKLDADQLARLLREHQDLYLEPDMQWLMISAISSAVRPGDAAAVEVLRQASRDAARGGGVLPALVEADLDWIIAHPFDWLDGDGERLRSLLFNVRDEGTVERVVRAIAAGPSELRAGAIRAIREQVVDRDRAAHLISLLG